MHNYILVDIIEVYDVKSHEGGFTFLEGVLSVGEPEFIGHKYVVGCYTCEETRIVREDTFNKMVKLGLIEEVVIS